MDMEMVLKRKVTKLAKTWAPVLLLMGLLITVDSFDSVQGASLIRTIKQTLGFATHHHHHHYLLELPPYTMISSNIKTNNDKVNTRLGKYWIARHLLLHRPTSPQLAADHPTRLRPDDPPSSDQKLDK